MKDERSGVHVVVVILIVFSVSIGILHGRKINKTVVTNLDVNDTTAEGIATLSHDEAYDYLNAIIQSRNIKLLAQVIGQFVPQTAKELVEKIMRDQAVPLTDEEKLTLLFAVAHFYQGKKSAQHLLFDLLFSEQKIQKDLPALLVVARSAYADVIPSFIQWIKDRRTEKTYKKYEDFLTELVNQALVRAVVDNDVKALDVMTSKNVRIKPPLASTLLWQAVTEGKDPAFVSFLVRRVHADVDYSKDEKRTLLIKATENNNFPLVRALLEEGAKIDLILNPSVGSALQIAIENAYTAIEVLLRDFGARE